jgi:hypothetical protein
MHIIDTMILSAMKASFEGLTSIKDQCEVLDMFYSMCQSYKTFYGRKLCLFIIS